MNFELAGFYDVRSFRLFNEHGRDELQFEHYSDDWDEEDDANGWRCSTWQKN